MSGQAYIRAAIQPNGALLITANNEARAELAQAFRDGGYPKAESAVIDGLHERYSWVRPELIGALTDAPILTEYQSVNYADDGVMSVDPDAKVWWFPGYEMRDPWRELADKGRVVFTDQP